MNQTTPLSEKESLALIAQMINKAKDSYHSTGMGAMMWGAVITICSLVRLAEIHYNFRLPFDIYLLTLVAIIPQIFITIKEKRSQKVKSYDDPFMDYLWLGFGICIFLLVHAINLLANDLQPLTDEVKRSGFASNFHLYEYIAPLFLILYGMPTFVTGAACKFKPMLWGGLLCWACSIITVYTSVKIDLMLTALSALMAWFIPGLIMEKEYREYIKAQVQADV
ncbi:MAG TPA: hypothetical protein VFZ42_07475 [Chitinophagaceae bacterium]